MTQWPASAFAGLFVGAVAGVIVGPIWTNSEVEHTEQRLVESGVPRDLLHRPKVHLLDVQDYAAIGLQYGICIGALLGFGGGWFWDPPSRSVRVSIAVVLGIACLLGAGTVVTNARFREQTNRDVERVPREVAGWDRK